MLTLGILLFCSLATAVATNDLRLDGGDDLGWETDQWRVQVDGVMGGLSDGSLEFLNSVMSFSGDIRLEGGGFSSVRRRFDTAVDLSQYAGIVVELETTETHIFDPNNIQAPLGLHLQFHDQPSRYGYASAFAIPLTDTAGTDTSVFLPLASFDRASRMGFQCSDCILDTTAINEMDLYVLFQEGPFHVQIKSITAVQNATSFPSPIISMSTPNQVKTLSESTISSGGKLYDYGYGELCIAIYRSTLNTLLASTVADTSTKSLICQGLDRAADFETTDKVDVAWTLRGTLDAVLEAGSDSDFRPIISMAEEDDWKDDECFAVTSFPPILLTEGNATATSNFTHVPNSTVP